MKYYSELTAYKVYAAGESLEHIAGVKECVYGEATAHSHYEQTYDSERDHGSDVVWNKFKVDYIKLAEIPCQFFVY